jgi:putative GTP pyrophosphokinase
MIVVKQIMTNSINGNKSYKLNDDKWYTLVDTVNLILKYGGENCEIVRGNKIYIRAKSGYKINRVLSGYESKVTDMEELSKREVLVEQELPGIEVLKSISVNTKYTKSISKVDIGETSLFEIRKMIADCEETVRSSKFDLSKWDLRVKSEGSALLKIKKYLGTGASLRIALNDLIGIRVLRRTYEESYPDYFKVVDLREGKKNDDGYRAVHLYYQLDSRHLPIEVQVWAGRDIEFNQISHEVAYKNVSNGALRILREEFDRGNIKSRQDFVNAMQLYN